jgi:hypothetical protein
VVTTLGWIGVAALPELTRLLNDPDESIAQDALTQWEMGFEEIEDPVQRAAMLNLAMQVLQNQDDLEMLVLSYNDLPDDIAARQLTALILNAPPIASEVARDHFLFVTGEDFVSAANTERWIKEFVIPEQ